MTLHLDTLLEGAPAYGVLDARDGVVLFRRSGHEAEFDAIAAEAIQSAGRDFEVIPLKNHKAECDRLFVVPREGRSFDPG